MNFYAFIIGTEILNARREDKHFIFLRDELAKYGHELYASFIVKDDEELMKKSFELIKNDSDSIMFSFGGIGSTPDDLTRKISSKIFSDGTLIRHKKFENDIIERFGDDAYPHRVFMADLPKDAELIFNPFNNMSGYSLYKRFFFVPGFPQMAHPMIRNVIKELFSSAKKKFRYTLIAQTSENTLIDIMKKIPNDVELSSLPMIKESNISVEISLSGYDESNVKHYFNLFKIELDKNNIKYIVS
jgi:molybdopterin-biosynthesis enzyme MoeA-like protein